MDKRTKNSNGSGILDIKTGIGVYRGVAFVSCVLAFWAVIVYIAEGQGKTEILVSIVIACILLLMVIFMENIVYALRLPSYHLFVTQNEITYKKGRKKFVYKVDDINLSFHKFNLDLPSQLQISFISSKEEDLYIMVTKRQYKLIKEFLDCDM